MVNSLTTKKQTTKFSSANFEKMLSELYINENSKTRRANSVDLDEVALHEPPHQDLRCLQIQLFMSLVVKELNHVIVRAVISLTSSSCQSVLLFERCHWYLFPFSQTVPHSAVGRAPDS